MRLKPGKMVSRRVLENSLAVVAVVVAFEIGKLGLCGVTRGAKVFILMMLRIGVGWNVE